MKQEEKLKEAKRLYQTANADQRYVLESLFPELAESEDEKIRKWIIDDIRYNMNNEPLNNSEYKKQAQKALAWLEKQGEQKSVDNVEPKFNVGDWVIFKDKSVYKVKNIHNYEYTLQHILGGTMPLPFSSKNLIRPWTIQDAKDGDVLTVNGKPFIYYHTDEYKGNYCCIDNIGCFRTNIRFSFEGNCILPATKEQRDLLFQKMKESGYTFDFEKKELKKIEDKEYNGEDYGIDSLFHAQRILEKTLGEVEGYQTDDGILSHKCAITAIKKLYEQKPAWSEADERNLQGVIDEIQANKNNAPDYDISTYDRFLSWMDNIKQRMGGEE